MKGGDEEASVGRGGWVGVVSVSRVSMGADEDADNSFNFHLG